MLRMSSQNKLTLLSSLLLCIAPVAARTQGVSFAGIQTTLQLTGRSSPGGVLVDSAGDLFVTDAANNRVLELPWTSSGYGSQITLPATGLNYPQGLALDGAGDLFIVDENNNRVLELPKSGAGYGTQVTLPLSGLNYPWGSP